MNLEHSADLEHSSGLAMHAAFVCSSSLREIFIFAITVSFSHRPMFVKLMIEIFLHVKYD